MKLFMNLRRDKALSLWFATWLIAFLASTVLAGCGGGSGDDDIATPGGETPTQPTPPTHPGTPTARGTPQGTASSALIGADGGSVASADGRIRVTVPAGAFAAPTTVEIQPITNTAHGGFGSAYRITPEGLSTPVPMTISFNADDAALDGSALNALRIATQDAQGRWSAQRAPQRDAAARTVSVSTTHFSDWAVTTDIRLKPAGAAVPVSQSLDLIAVSCRGISMDEITMALEPCQETGVIPGEFQDWSVNGVVGGSSAFGTVAPLDGRPGFRGTGRFTAPGQVPGDGPVAVSVKYVSASDAGAAEASYTLVANVWILPVANCAWLRGAEKLDYRVELGYTFQGSGPLGNLTLNQQGVIEGTITRVDVNDLFGTWQGLTTRGSASLHDSHTSGDVTSQLYGEGAPAIGQGIDGNQISGVTLVVDFTNCTYSVVGQVAVLATSGAAGDVPRAKNVGAFTRGNVTVDSVDHLAGNERMPPRLDPDAAGTYAPGGLGVGLIADGYGSPQGVGTASVSWNITRSAP